MTRLPRLTSAGFTALYRMAMHEGTVPTAPRTTVRKLINDGHIECTDTTDAGHIYTVTEAGRDALAHHVDRIASNNARVGNSDEAAIADDPGTWTRRVFATQFVPAVIAYANDHYRDGAWASVIDTIDRPTLTRILADHRPRVLTETDAVAAVAEHLGHPLATLTEPLADTLTGAGYTVHAENGRRDITGLLMAGPRNAGYAFLYDVEDGNLYAGPDAEARRLALTATLTRAGWDATDSGTNVTVTGPTPDLGLEPSSSDSRDARAAVGALAADAVPLADLVEDYDPYDIGANATVTGAFVSADGPTLTITHLVNGHDTDPDTNGRWHVEMDRIAAALITRGHRVDRQRRDTVTAHLVRHGHAAPGRNADATGNAVVDRAASVLAAHAVPLADNTDPRTDGALIRRTGEATVTITHLAGGWADPDHSGTETVGALSAHGWAITRNSRGTVDAQMPDTDAGLWRNRSAIATGGHRFGRAISTDDDPAAVAAVATLVRAGFVPTNVVGDYAIRNARFIGDGFVVSRASVDTGTIAPVVIAHIVDGRVLDGSPNLRHYARTLNASGWDAALHENRVTATPVKGANPYKASDAQLHALVAAAARPDRTVPGSVHGKVTAGLVTRGWVTPDPAFGGPVLNEVGHDVLRSAYPSLSGPADGTSQLKSLTSHLARLAQWRGQDPATGLPAHLPVRVEEFTGPGQCQNRDGDRHVVPHLTRYRVTVGALTVEDHDPQRIAERVSEALAA